jgi:hypothetical protein
MQTRRRLVAGEVAAAKGEAARAKADGDKGRQRAAGEMIRGLKQEMAELGALAQFCWNCCQADNLHTGGVCWPLLDAKAVTPFHCAL